jgi:hypothetical protein
MKRIAIVSLSVAVLLSSCAMFIVNDEPDKKKSEESVSITITHTTTTDDAR